MNNHEPTALSLSQRQRDQMLKLVAKGFYNELINYGVEKGEILRVTSHLLDNLMTQQANSATQNSNYSDLFTIETVRNDWQIRRELAVQHVSLRPLRMEDIPKFVGWLSAPGVQESFVPAFPAKPEELQRYLIHPTREYFVICFQNRAVGIVGGENLDPASGKLEMKKLVGEPGLQGKGIGKRATFAFLYHAFMTLGMNKVYIHSRDINMRNINLNSRFGFELEGVFLEELLIGGKRQDVVRMALFKPRWLQIFRANGAPA